MSGGQVNIRANLEQVSQRIRGAALRAGRRPEEIRRVAITKTVSVAAIREAMACGVRIFGESRVQEALPKIQELGGDHMSWHFVGHLQTNKTKQVVGLFDLIHSVDSLKLAMALDASMSTWSEKTGSRQKVLVQVNISGEETKSGVSPEEVGVLLKGMVKCKGLFVVGLMTLPPRFDDPEYSRPFFKALRELAISIEKEGIDGVSLRELSMGMSGDFEVAIEEGATLVRIGEAIFGQRNSEK